MCTIYPLKPDSEIANKYLAVCINGIYPMTITIGVVTYYQVGRSSVVENADPAVG